MKQKMETKNIQQKKFRFRNFKVYQESRRASIQIKKLIRKCFPKEEMFGLTSQTSRALDSIILNIAEGAERNTDKDFALFLTRSLASLNEVVACLDIAVDNGYITGTDLNENVNVLENLANQISAFRKTLQDKPTK